MESGQDVSEEHKTSSESEKHKAKDSKPEKSERNAKHEKAEYNANPEKSERNPKHEKSEHNAKHEKSEHNAKYEKSEHNAKPEKAEHNAKPEKAERNAKHEKSEHNANPETHHLKHEAHHEQHHACCQEEHSHQHKKKFKSGRFVWFIIVIIIIILAVLLIKKYSGSSTPSNDGIAASVNGDLISIDELDLRYSKIPPVYQSIISKQDFLNQLVEERLLLQKAKEMNVEVTGDEIQEEINSSLIKLDMTKEEFLERLSEQNVSEEDFMDAVKTQLIITKYLEKTAYRDIDVTDEEIDKFYGENIDLFSTPEQVRASHILISNTERDDELAKAVVEALLNNKDIKENFADFAKENSEDPGSGSRGGDLGFFSRGQMVKPFEDSAFSLEVGELSGAVKTQFGYHIILVTDKKAAEIKTLEEVKDDLRTQLEQEKQQELLLPFLEGLKEESDINIFAEFSQSNSAEQLSNSTEQLIELPENLQEQE